ncbi:MAG: 3'-5' exonuclease [Desulfuromonadales bacterium]|nr:3'-5' exonuclease [Desulfuromonadales bacterium]
MESVIFDIETTGLSPSQGHRIIELGAVRLSAGQVVDEFHSLIDAGVPIDPRAQAVHGISRTMLLGQPQPEQAIRRFREFLGAARLVAHNAPFDTRFLRAEFAQFGHDLPNSIECTLKLSRRLLSLSNYRLETVYRHLGGELSSRIQRHRALDDARMAAFVWIRLLGKERA